MAISAVGLAIFSRAGLDRGMRVRRRCPPDDNWSVYVYVSRAWGEGRAGLSWSQHWVVQPDGEGGGGRIGAPRLEQAGAVLCVIGSGLLPSHDHLTSPSIELNRQLERALQTVHFLVVALDCHCESSPNSIAMAQLPVQTLHRDPQLLYVYANKPHSHSPPD